MSQWPEGRAIVYCEGAFDTTNGKTAHGLVRRSERYGVVGGDRLRLRRPRRRRGAGRPANGHSRGGRPRRGPGAGRAAAARPPTSWSAWRRTAAACPAEARADVAAALTRGPERRLRPARLPDRGPGARRPWPRSTGAVIRDVRKPPPRDRAALLHRQDRGGRRLHGRAAGHRLGRRQAHHRLAAGRRLARGRAARPS